MHLITLLDWEADQIRNVLGLAHELKARARDGGLEPTLARKTLALVFEKASMRTRVSFEVAMTQLGGHVTYLSRDDVNLGVREPIKDGARVLSRYVDVIAARVYDHATVEQLAAYATVPVINALSDAYHPCQALADMMTIEERFDGPVNVAYVGDGNNAGRSLAVICSKLGYPFTIAVPPAYAFGDDFLSKVSDVRTVHDPAEAAEGTDVLYTDVWTSMGQEDEAERRRQDFAGFCVDAALLARASERCIVMHDMPAHRDEEITDEVIEGPQSAIFDQAENRLHAERALLQMLLSG